MIRLPEWSLLLLVSAMLLALWRWRHWKNAARRRSNDLAAWKEALRAVAFESTNAVNAIRANLLDFRQVNPGVAMPEHLDQIAAGADRIASIVRIADDPLRWHQERKRKPTARSPQPQPAAPMIGDPEAR